MTNIQFLGAAGMVTGSCYLLTQEMGGRILIDLGMFQDPNITYLNNQQLAFDPKALSGVVITHAHLDHCGRLPLLVKQGFKEKIYMTEATRELVFLALRDAAKIASEHKEHESLYTEGDVEKTFQYFITVAYDEPFSLGDCEVTLRNAGHILGASVIEIIEKKSHKKIVFSGDLGNNNQRLLQPTASIESADTVIMESTYGDSMHPNEDTQKLLQTEINIIENSGGVLLIPAFALDRTQVLLHMINHLKKDGKIKSNTPCFLDTPMGIEATMIYKKNRNLWSEELKNHTDDPFDFPGLSYTQEAKESEHIANISGPKIIIAGNGMMTGGRIWHHLINYLPFTTTRVLIVGYQGQETLGRRILEGAKQVKIYHEEISVQATITQMEGLSAHADQQRLLEWLQQIQGVHRIFLTHGENAARKTLAQKIKQNLHIQDVLLPQIDEIQDVYRLKKAE